MRAAALAPLLVCLTFCLTACGPGDRVGGDVLVGEWQWLETSDGPTGETRSSAGHRWRLRFDPDGAVLEEYAGRPPAEGVYGLETRQGAETAAAVVVLELSGEDLVMSQDAPYEVVVLADTLLLRSDVGDGFSYRFVRVGPR